MSKSRQEEYISLAKRKGFNVLAMDRTRAGHIRVDIESAKGVKFSTSLASTPSHKKGPNNWVQNLRRLERETLERQEANMPKIIIPDSSHHTQRLSTEDHQKARDVLQQMQQDLNVLLTRYEYASGTYAWYLNHDRTTNKGHLPTRICNELIRKELIQVAEASPDEDGKTRKIIFSLTTKGGLLVIPQPEPFVETLTPEEAKAESDWFKKEQERNETAQKQLEETVDKVVASTRDQMIIDALSSLQDDEVKKLLYFGVELLKEDIQKEVAKLNARLQPLEEVLACLS